MSDTNFDITFADAELRQLADSLPLSAGDPTGPKRRADRRSRHSRFALGGTLSAALLLGGIQLANIDRDPQEITLTAPETSLPEQVDIEADGVTSIPDLEFEPSISIHTLNADDSSVGDNIAFKQTLVNSPVGRPWLSTVSAEGTIYSLAQVHDGRLVDGSLTEAIYATKEGENWTVAEQVQRNFGQLLSHAGILYALTYRENADASTSVFASSSDDGGTSWTDSFLIKLPPSSGEEQPAASPHTTVDLTVIDGAMLAYLETSWSLDIEKLLEQLGIEDSDSISVESGTDGLIIRDRSECREAQRLRPDSAATEEVCIIPLVLADVPFAEVGLPAGGWSSIQAYGLLSNDSINWEKVDLPTGRVFSTGDHFVSSNWIGDDVSIISQDGRNWTEFDTSGHDLSWRSGQLGNGIGSFWKEAVPFEVDDETGLPKLGRLYFATSATSSSWEDVSMHYFDLPEKFDPDFMTVTPTGAYFSQLDSSGAYQLFYSFDGYNWKQMEITDFGDRELIWVFMTKDSISMTFELESESRDVAPELVTLLVTPTQS